jgi:site-specific DNA-methyltransferase (adenine-specific)
MNLQDTYRIEPGDNLDVLKRLIAEGIQVDSVVTDPPYGLKFMNRKWDHAVPSVEFFKLALQILKPGGYLLAFGGTRTYHRMVVNIEDAGFQITDQLVWIYGNGLPKSWNVSKAIDEAADAERKVIGASTTPKAAHWEGRGTRLKPAMEPIVLARKPLSEKTVAANVLKYGTGAINIDGCRVGSEGGCHLAAKSASRTQDANNVYGAGLAADFAPRVPGLGRWPANVILDEEAGAVLDEQSGYSKSRKESGTRTIPTSNEIKLVNSKTSLVNCTYDDQGGASRFFYCPKASNKERRGSKHPTVKPLSLMRWLCRLVTPAGGTVLDPFAGTGTTGEAAVLEGSYPILIEREAEYVKDIEKRLAAPMDIKPKPTVAARGRKNVDIMSKPDEAIPPAMRDERFGREGVRRSENGRKIIDCEKCGAKDVEESAYSLCFTCYRGEQRAKKRKATNMTLPAQRREQLRVMKLFSTLEQAAVGLGFDEGDIEQLRLLAAPHVEVVPWLLGDGPMNSEQDAA